MNNDGHAPHTSLTWESHHKKQWEKEDSPHKHQVIRQDEVPCYFQIHKGKKILAGDAGSVRNLQVPENNRVINAKDAIPLTCSGDPAERTCIQLDPGRGSTGAA